MKPRHIILFWRWSLAVMLAAVLAVGLVRLWPRLFPSHYASELYRHYADMPNIDASFLHNFPLNDTLTIDVTLLQATDSTGWEQLKKDFNIRDYPPEALPHVGTNSLELRYAPKINHTLPPDTILLSNDYIVIFREKHNISVFDLKYETQKFEITKYQFKQIKNKQQ